MDRIEEIVGRIEEEVRRLRGFLEQEVAPQAERRTAEFLREVSEKLSQAASKLESRVASRPPKS